MPNGEAQESLIRSVYKAAGLDPMETAYVEAYGTGTATGDPIEAAALGEVFGRRSDQRPIIIGSLKSNIGHLEGTSGIASVIKTALMLERRFLIPKDVGAAFAPTAPASGPRVRPRPARAAANSSVSSAPPPLSRSCHRLRTQVSWQSGVAFHADAGRP